MHFLYNCFLRKTNETFFEKKHGRFSNKSGRLPRKSVELTCMENTLKQNESYSLFNFEYNFSLLHGYRFSRI